MQPSTQQVALAIKRGMGSVYHLERMALDGPQSILTYWHSEDEHASVRLVKILCRPEQIALVKRKWLWNHWCITNTYWPVDPEAVVEAALHYLSGGGVEMRHEEVAA